MKDAQEKIAQNKNNLSNLFHGQAEAEYYLIGSNIILMAYILYSCKLLIYYSLPLNYDFTEPVFSPSSSASGMVNKINYILNLSSIGKCPKLLWPMLGIKIKQYSSKYFIQNNPEAKNNFHPLFL